MGKEKLESNYEYNKDKPFRLKRPMCDCSGCDGCSDWRRKMGYIPCIKLISEKNKDIVVE